MIVRVMQPPRFAGTIAPPVGGDGVGFGVNEGAGFGGGDTVVGEDGFGEVGGGGVVGSREGVEGVEGREEEGSVVVLGLGLHVSLLVGVGGGGAVGDGGPWKPTRPSAAV